MNKQTQLSAVGRVMACLDRIEEIDPSIRAWEFLDREAALNAAAQTDRIHAGKPLHGWIVGVKDNHDTCDMPTSYGSPIYRGHRPASDCAVVSRLRANGAVVLGKTVSTEFAAWPPSRTRNPRNPDHTPGGSSSGSAAAVASGMVPVALGTQTLGSVIRPASYCGVVGFKPSFGRISRVGIRPLADSLDTVGVFATSVPECAHVYGILADHAAMTEPAAAGDRPPPLAFCQGPAWARADADAREAMVDYVKALRGRGLMIDEIELPAEFASLPEAAKLIHDFEMRHGFLTEYIHHADKLSEQFRQGFEHASRISISDYEQAVELGEACREKLAGVLAGRTVLSLAATGEAPQGHASTGDPAMNSFWTLLHAPCITLPKLHGKLGLPIGLQIVAPRFADQHLLRVATWLEQL
ncbi:amidase [Bradyrhizobium sp. NP1]|uniref:amidase n=1 Tax=Bradyrhizobium sp. NP1 TaxID=3049772 RepID=UPI0025A5610F|nr:amidase [Bradyrhizobium sp. NP1]WJR80888.1 amidase [Bradyrhizobium sp. NP1]